MKKLILGMVCAVLLISGNIAYGKGGTDQTVGDYLPKEITGVYSGNVKTRKYHNERCKFFDCRDCTVKFKSAAEARKAGYDACGKCGG